MNELIVKKGSIKGLETYLSKLKAARQILILRLGAIQNDLSGNKKQIAEVQERLQQLRDKGLTVSEHAILRYIERVDAIPPGEVSSRILTPQLQEMVATLGSGTFPLDGFSVLVKNNVVVTVFKES